MLFSSLPRRLTFQALKSQHVTLRSVANNFRPLDSWRTSDPDLYHIAIACRMAVRESSRYLARAVPRAFVPSTRAQAFLGRRNASDEAPSRRLSDQLDELETASSLTSPVSETDAKSFDPVTRAKGRKTQLPRSR
jgi:hypothetical protein